MLSSPKPGDRVVLHYRRAAQSFMPHHGKHGAIVVAGRGRPRNHLVQLDDDRRVIVPAGNLRREEPAT